MGFKEIFIFYSFIYLFLQKQGPNGKKTSA